MLDLHFISLRDNRFLFVVFYPFTPCNKKISRFQVDNSRLYDLLGVDKDASSTDIKKAGPQGLEPRLACLRKQDSMPSSWK